MTTSVIRACHALGAIVSMLLVYGCALDAAPDVGEPGMAAAVACGTCPQGYTAKPNVPGTCAYGYTCSCEGDWAVACGTTGGACVSCDTGETCSAAGSCTDTCSRGGHDAGSECTVNGLAGKWGASSSGCVCCTGCFHPDSGLCQNGTADSACGTGGEWCTSCGSGTSCSSAFIVGECLPPCTVNADCDQYESACVLSLCQAGHCISGNVAQGTACPGGQCDGAGHCN